MSLPWFAERITGGYVIRFGASRRPQKYTHAFTILDDGEFVGVSTKPLNITVVRTAMEAGRQLLNGKEPYWRHIKTQEKRMSESIATLSIASKASPSDPFYKSEWHLSDDNDLVDFEEVIALGLIALGRKRAGQAGVTTAKAS